MSFPPYFLEEIRSRLPLVDRVSRRVKLVRHGREHTGLCPFHNEKSPSFTVSEDKGFFHCFGCGAHGDVIGFVMRSENLNFPDAIERLAAEAGLEVPRATPAERERAHHAKTLHDVMEAAADFYQAQLDSRDGEAARVYLAGRGIGPAEARWFRLGYAPPESGALARHLGDDFPVPLLDEAGLTKLPEDGRNRFDYFRGRIMFPIFDRRGRVIAFGGRILGDGKPKYLNSPETPLFQKGRELYGLSWAREGVGKGAALVVTEGYMDTIALHLAGFEGAVAPLGTALTEDQMEALWKLDAEPILCFDGDSAGGRAAERALERALPLLNASRSLRFAVLPTGEDPDSLVRKFGADAMETVVKAAKPLAEFIWGQQLALRKIDTPERRAELDARLGAIVQRIPDASLRREYQRFFKNCLYERLGTPKRQMRRMTGSASRLGRTGRLQIVERMPGLPPQPALTALARREEEVLIRLVLEYPELLDEVLEEFAGLKLVSADLDKLRDAIINVHATFPVLDATTLRQHLSPHDYAGVVEQLLAPNASEHVRFAIGGGDASIIRRGWKEAVTIWRRKRNGASEREAAIRRYEEHPSEEAWAHVLALPAQSEQELLEQSDIDPETEGFH